MQGSQVWNSLGVAENTLGAQRGKAYARCSDVVWATREEMLGHRGAGAQCEYSDRDSSSSGSSTCGSLAQHNNRRGGYLFTLPGVPQRPVIARAALPGVALTHWVPPPRGPAAARLGAAEPLLDPVYLTKQTNKKNQTKKLRGVRGGRTG